MQTKIEYLAPFTKGPWAWQQFGHYHLLAAQHGMREIIIGSRAVKGPQETYPAMNKGGILAAITPDHPNARLIAAAPDLLSILKRLIDAIDDPEGSFDCIGDAKDLYNKITGANLTYHKPQL